MDNSERRSEGRFAMRAVSEMTGVKPATLRAWERRYRLLRPVRSEAGHRLYSADDVVRIRRIVDWTRQGISPAQAGALLRDADRALTTPGAEDWQQRRERAMGAVARFDEEALDALYRATLAVHPLTDVTESLTVPVLEALGRRWENEGLVAEEHFFRLYVRNALGSRLFHRIRGQRGRTLVAACVPGERHDIGLMLFCLAAEAEGFRVVNLGADTPLAELPRVAETCGAVAIVLSATYQNRAANCMAELRQLAAVNVCPVLVGGRGVEQLKEAVEDAGVFSLGSDIRGGSARLSRLLEGDGP